MSTVERAEMLLEQDATIREKIKSGATLDEAVDPSNKEFGPLAHPEQVQMRVAKRAMMLEAGIAPYPVHLDVTDTIEAVRAKYAARSMADAGGFPKTYKEVLALKGVGEYTAAAICSFAYGMPYAVVDGNVYRVLSRWLGIETPIDSAEGKRIFAEVAAELLDKAQPGIYNQAIMDFGALQCTPASPNCMFCPFVDTCVARQKGVVDTLPVKQHKAKVANRYFNYIYVRMGAHTLINKRTGNDIWKNLYELPLIETENEVPEEKFYALSRWREMLAEGETPLVRLVQKGVKHVLSHRVIYANFYEVILPEDSASFAQYQRIRIEDLHKFAVSRLVNQFFSLILKPDN